MKSVEIDSDLKCSQGVVPKCDCGLIAKLRTSRTLRNPSRLFYNCKNYDQCGFFEWADEQPQTGDKHLDEMNEIRSECVRLLESKNLIQEELDSEREAWHDERAAWNEEREELMSKLSSLEKKLDEIKTGFKILKESDLMPPPYDDKLSDPKVEEEDDAMVIQTV